MSAVISPQEGDQQAGKEQKAGEEDIEEMFTRVCQESLDDALGKMRETGEEGNRARARSRGSAERQGSGAAKLNPQQAQLAPVLRKGTRGGV